LSVAKHGDGEETNKLPPLSPTGSMSMLVEIVPIEPQKVDEVGSK